MIHHYIFVKRPFEVSSRPNPDAVFYCADREPRTAIDCFAWRLDGCREILLYTQA